MRPVGGLVVALLALGVWLLMLGVAGAEVSAGVVSLVALGLLVLVVDVLGGE